MVFLIKLNVGLFSGCLVLYIVLVSGRLCAGPAARGVFMVFVS